MESSLQLPLVPHFDIDPLVQTQPDEVQGLLNSRGTPGMPECLKTTTKCFASSKKFINKLQEENQAFCCAARIFLFSIS